MKTYREMADDALRRIEEYQQMQRGKGKKIQKATMSVLGLCVVALVGISAWRFAKLQMSSQVLSREPSLTNSTRLLSLIMPFSVRLVIFCRNIGAVMGSTCSSL